MSLNYNWGFNRNDHHWAPPREVIHNVCDVVSKGGNLLLNVGPDGQGRIPQPAQYSLKVLGAWMKLNGEAIYATRRWRASGDAGVRYTRKGESLYALLLDWPEQGVMLSQVPEAQSAVLIADGRPVEYRMESGGLRLLRPRYLPGEHAWGVRLEGVPLD